MVSCLGPRNGFHWETVLELVTEGCIVVSDSMLISILSMLVEPLEMLCAEAADALAPQVWDLKAEDLLSPLHLMCVFKKLNLSRIQFCLLFLLEPDQTWTV